MAKAEAAAPKQMRKLEAQVTQEDARAARHIAPGLASRDAIGALPAARRAGTLQLAYEYGSVLIDRDEGDRARRKAILGAITGERLALDKPERLVSRAAPANPEDGHDGGLLATGMRRRGGQDAISLEYAAFQHTLTNPLPGYEAHAEISLLNPELVVRRDRIRVERIDWLIAQSTIPSSMLLTPRAWRLQLSTASRPFADRRHMATSMAYHSGKAWLLGADTVLSVLPGASVEASSALPHHAGWRATHLIDPARRAMVGTAGSRGRTIHRRLDTSALRRPGLRRVPTVPQCVACARRVPARAAVARARTADQPEVAAAQPEPSFAWRIAAQLDFRAARTRLNVYRPSAT
jgi:hypothetical protein